MGSGSAGSTKIRGTPYNFVYGGHFYWDGWPDVGSSGGYWSSTQRSSTIGYILYLGSSNLSANRNLKNFGMSVRCVASGS